MTPQANALEMSSAEKPHRLDRRVAVRHLCNRKASVRPGDGMKVGALPAMGATVRNISATGVGLLLDCKVLSDTILLVESWQRWDTMPMLLARVQLVRPQEGGWYVGCELAHHLDVDELEQWLP